VTCTRDSIASSCAALTPCFLDLFPSKDVFDANERSLESAVLSSISTYPFYQNVADRNNWIVANVPNFSGEWTVSQVKQLAKHLDEDQRLEYDSFTAEMKTVSLLVRACLASLKKQAYPRRGSCCQNKWICIIGNLVVAGHSPLVLHLPRVSVQLGLLPVMLLPLPLAARLQLLHAPNQSHHQPLTSTLARRWQRLLEAENAYIMLNNTSSTTARAVAAQRRRIPNQLQRLSRMVRPVR